MNLEELFKELTDKVWDSEDMKFGYFTPNSSVWHLPDGRNIKVSFTEVSLVSMPD